MFFHEARSRLSCAGTHSSTAVGSAQSTTAKHRVPFSRRRLYFVSALVKSGRSSPFATGLLGVVSHMLTRIDGRSEQILDHVLHALLETGRETWIVVFSASQ